MLRDDAVARIKRRLLNRTGTSLDTTIVNSLKDAQERMEGEKFLPWFLLSEVSSISTTVGEERLPLPTDFLREYEEDALWYFNASATSDEDRWKALFKDDLDLLRDAYPGSGAPQGYALVGEYFRLFPTPDAAYPIKMIYYQADTVLDTNVENNWLKHAPWWLIGEAGTDVALSLGAEKVADRFEKQALASRERVYVETTAREEAGRRRTRGEN